MGALCCKSKKFEGEGYRLNEMKTEGVVSTQPTGARQMDTNAMKVGGDQSNTRGKPGTHGPIKTEPNDSGQQNEDPRRAAAEAAEARAKAAQAAEARAKAAKVRGTKGGEIAKSLAQLPSDGGRLESAITAGSSHSNQKPIIWD